MNLRASVVACCLPPPTSAAPPRLLNSSNNQDHRPRTVGRRYPSIHPSIHAAVLSPSVNLFRPLTTRLLIIISCAPAFPGSKRPRAQEQRARHSRRHLPLQCTCLFLLVSRAAASSGTKPGYLGVQKSPPSLALCPATNNCVSTSEKISDSNHYAPPWNYNPNDGRRGKPISKDEAMKELIEVVTKTKPDNFSPRVVEKGDDYVRVEYESPIFGFVDDVEFWFPPGKKSIVQYRSASRSGFIDFDANKKRVKALRLALEKKGWASESSF